MSQQTGRAGRAGRIVLWIVSIVLAIGIGLAGAAKFFAPSWHELFIGWGYATWFLYVIGTAEVAGAIGLLVPRIASYAAMLLAAVMIGAFVTVRTHPGGKFGGGDTPAVYVVLLASIAAARWKERSVARA